MKLYVVTVTEVYSDPDMQEITSYVNHKAFRTFEEAKENLVERYEAAKENILEYCMNDDGDIVLDSQGYTEDGYGRAELFNIGARVSNWDSEGMNNAVEIKIEEVEVAE